jgi:hypothetical protein
LSDADTLKLADSSVSHFLDVADLLTISWIARALPDALTTAILPVDVSPT